MKNITQLYKTILLMFVINITCPVTNILFAQEEQPQAEIKAIQGTEILSKSEEASNLVSEIMAAFNDETYNLIASELPENKKLISELKQSSSMKNLNQSSETKLLDLKQKWLGYRLKITAATKKNESFSKSLEEKRQDLVNLKEVWDLTASMAKSEKLPKQLTNQAHTVISEISTAELGLRKEIDRHIELQNQFFVQINEINKILTEIDKTLGERESDYMSIKAEPLWKVFQNARKSEDKKVSVFNTLNDDIEILVKFYDEHKSRIIFHIICYILLVAALISVRKFKNEIMIDRDFSELSQNILNHPWAVAILVTLLLSRSFYPLAPDIIIKLSRMIILLAVVRLIPMLHIPKLRKNAVFFSGLYFINIIYLLSAEQTLISRLLLIIITVISVAYMFLLLRLSIFSDPSFKNRLTLFSKIFIKFLTVILIISFISNVIGNISLAALLTTASLFTIFLAFILLISSNVIISIISLLLQTKLAHFSRIIEGHAERIKSMFSRFIYLLTSLFFLIRALDNFKVFYPAYYWILDLVSVRLQIGSVDISLADILIFFLAIYVSVYISRFIQFILNEDVFIRMHLPRGIPTTISLLSKYLIVGLGFMIAISAAGFDLSKFAIVFGALGVGIGFGLQNIVNNFISGLILIFERPVQTGDTVALGSLLGTVTSIGIRASTIRTFDGSEVIVPNSKLIENEVVNWTLSDRRRRIEINVGVAYGSDPEFVLKILKETVSNIPNVLKNPEPLILFQEFGDSSLNFSVRFWTERIETWLELKSTTAIAINNAFKKVGISIPFPQRDLHLNTVDEKIIQNFKDSQQGRKT
jgi:potassium-dependent mechanosensitive channel